MSTDAAEMMVVGKITTVYGVKGWVKIHSFTDPMENFLDYQNCYLDRGEQWEPIDFEVVKRHGKGLVAQIKGVSDRDKARVYCQSDIAIPKQDFPKLPADEFYWHQLKGMQVVSHWHEQGEDSDPANDTEARSRELLLGTVTQLMETGANDVLVVGKCKNSIDTRERLVPWIRDQVIKKVDIDSGVIHVEWDPDF